MTSETNLWEDFVKFVLKNTDSPGIIIPSSYADYPRRIMWLDGGDYVGIKQELHDRYGVSSVTGYQMKYTPILEANELASFNHYKLERLPIFDYAGFVAPKLPLWSETARTETMKYYALRD